MQDGLLEIFDNTKVYEQLKQQIEKNTVVPFIGAGISAYAYSTWTNLLLKLAGKYGIDANVSSLLQRNQYEEAASLLENKLTKNTFQSELESEYPNDTNHKAFQFSNSIVSIVRIWKGNIITTNFDHILDYAIQSIRNQIPQVIIPHDLKNLDLSKRAVQKSNPTIFKIHGDIDHHVFTKEEYDETYGNGPDNVDETLPMPQALKNALQARMMLFLGCSLSFDRTMRIVESLSTSEHFAITELPKETENVSDPLTPILRNSDGNFIKAFDNRRTELAKRNIHCIWYPYGQHDYVEKILKDLEIIFAPVQNITDFELLHGLIGRNDIVEELTDSFLSAPKSKIIAVVGAPGIGKTEVCKQVCRDLIYKNNMLQTFFIDLTGVSSLPDMYARIAVALHIEYPDTTKPDRYKDIVLSYVSHQKNILLYLDNWEDIWYSVKNDDQERKELYSFMKNIRCYNISILFSSRECPNDLCDGNPIELLPLSLPETNDLFQTVCINYNELSDEGEKYIELLNNLEGHPLATVLVASQASKVRDINELLQRWKKAKIKGANPRHDSLQIAVQMSWDQVSAYPCACDIWGILSLFRGDLHKQMMIRIFEVIASDTVDYQHIEYEEETIFDAIDLLLDSHLIFFRKTKLAMLSPIKEICFYLSGKDDPGSTQRSLYIISYYFDSCLHWNDIKNNEYNGFVLPIIPDILHTMELLIGQTEPILFETLNSLCYKMTNYYSYYPLSISTICKLIDFYKSTSEIQILSSLYINQESVYARIREYNKAFHSLSDAEKKQKQIVKDYSNSTQYAYLLSKRAQLKYLMNDLDTAYYIYNQAHNIFKAHNDEDGQLLCIIHKIEIHRMQHKISENDLVDLEYAEIKLRNKPQSLNLSNTLRLKGEIYSSKYADNLKDSELYQIAESALEECLNIRKKLFFEHGIADAYKSLGLLYKIEQPVKATNYFIAARNIFADQKDFSDLLYTYAELCDLYRRIKNKKEALYSIKKITYIIPLIFDPQIESNPVDYSTDQAFKCMNELSITHEDIYENVPIERRYVLLISYYETSFTIPSNEVEKDRLRKLACDY